jgi:hypothetical protein
MKMDFLTDLTAFPKNMRRRARANYKDARAHAGAIISEMSVSALRSVRTPGTKETAQ